MNRKKRVTSVAVAGILLTFAINALAQSFESTPKAKIGNMRVYSNYIAVELNPAHGSGLCTNTSWVVISPNFGNDNFKLMAATIMLARTTNADVVFGIRDICATFGGGTPTAYRIDLSE